MRIRTRVKILEYVAGHAGAGAAQIARGLGMNPPAVRHHLAIMKADGRIDAVAVHRLAGRGRPQLGYRISASLAGNNLAMLAEHLLSAFSEGALGQRGRAALVAKLAAKLSDQLQASEPGGNAGRRLARLVERMNQLHYASRWEAGAEGPRLIFGQCPYAAVIERHPELCEIDAQALAGIMATDVRQQAKIAPESLGSSCVFVLKQR
jgi:predicted ArsR family transcriptional regulator